MITDRRTTDPAAGPVAVAVVAVVLTCAAAALGAVPGWPAPDRVLSGWQVADVPPSTLAVVVAAAVGCLALAGALVRPGSTLPGRALPVLWWGVVLAAAAAQVWTDLFLAALSTDDGPVIPVFDWLYTLVPALVVGLAARSAGARAQLRATLGTAVVTLPMHALGWGLLSPGGVDDVLGTLRVTALLGLVPFLLVLSTTRVRSRS